MSDHFLRPPNMLTKFSETPKNYVDQFFFKNCFLSTTVCWNTFLSKAHVQNSSFSQENKEGKLNKHV